MPAVADSHVRILLITFASLRNNKVPPLYTYLLLCQALSTSRARKRPRHKKITARSTGRGCRCKMQGKGDKPNYGLTISRLQHDKNPCPFSRKHSGTFECDQSCSVPLAWQSRLPVFSLRRLDDCDSRSV